VDAGGATRSCGPAQSDGGGGAGVHRRQLATVS
jgi:hypothetical protein